MARTTADKIRLEAYLRLTREAGIHMGARFHQLTNEQATDMRDRIYTCRDAMRMAIDEQQAERATAEFIDYLTNPSDEAAA